MLQKTDVSQSERVHAFFVSIPNSVNGGCEFIIFFARGVDLPEFIFFRCGSRENKAFSEHKGRRFLDTGSQVAPYSKILRQRS